MEEALQKILNWVYRQSPEMLTMYSVYAALPVDGTGGLVRHRAVYHDFLPHPWRKL